MFLKFKVAAMLFLMEAIIVVEVLLLRAEQAVGRFQKSLRKTRWAIDTRRYRAMEGLRRG